jgi:hypothetical protein
VERIFPSSATVTDDFSLPCRFVDARQRATTEPAMRARGFCSRVLLN